jgi:carboxyl-terminal processing protease
VPLSLVKYKESQQRIRETVNQNNNLLKLKAELNVEVCSMDRVKFFSNPDKPKGERYQAWLRGVKSDMYIDQTTKIVSELAKAQKAVTAAK